jgi:hypothetical protein
MQRLLVRTWSTLRFCGERREAEGRLCALKDTPSVRDRTNAEDYPPLPFIPLKTNG